MALKLGIQTYQILTNDDEVCIPDPSSILLAVTDPLLDNLPPLLVHVVIERSPIQLTPHLSKGLGLCTGNKTNILIHLPLFLITLYKFGATVC